MTTRPALAGELRAAIMLAARRIRSQRGDVGLSDPQYTVLVWLTKRGPMTPGQLADLERIQPPSMTRTVNGLVELGLVAKDEHPTDGRQVVVSLTEAGKAEVRETRRRRDAWLTKQLSTMTPDERATLAEATELLRRIADS
ncbi:MarR family winged helix-turn-helix transcriptional regulator [Cellulomonas alba]|uniref:MarR family transcriptional regulator n=1 Tax=Cellulomonas alba TaxID=3053467 RepID=A0ABT7SH18_9CELL|nr:MarR family transcriptional regulator [Cellulomonas alba]MDM7855465.1 MarR family transcriptional regulator [Cellulomonas alba]